MEIVINVDGDKFQEIVDKELGAFSKEELHELCRKGILTCLNDNDRIKELFTRKTNGYYDQYQANEILRDAAKTVNFDELFGEVKEKIIDYVKNNYESLVKQIVFDSFINGLSRHICDNDEFKCKLSAEVWQQTQPHN